MWNEAGASLSLAIDPAYYQTVWFRALCTATFVGLLWALYRYRVHHIERECNMRLEERVGERTRIARDLHDTLLQSFPGLLLEFQAARNLFARRPEEAMHRLDEAISSAEAAIPKAEMQFRIYAQDQKFAATWHTCLRRRDRNFRKLRRHTADAAFHITVEGPPRNLPAVLQDEVYRMAWELLRNAFCHARARRIELEIRYDLQKLRFTDPR